MRKDKPCTGDKFGGPTCPKGSRRYNLAKTFKKMAKKAGGGPIKAQDSKFITKKKWWDNPKKLKKMLTQLRGEYSLMKESMAGKVSPSLIEKGKKLAKEKGFGWKSSVGDSKVEDKITKWDQVKGGQGFTPGWKPHLSVRTAKEGKVIKAKKGVFSGAASSMYDKPPGWEASKISKKTHKKLTKLWKHREAGGWKEAKGYKKHLKALKKATTTPLSGTSTTLPPKTARLLSQLKFAYKDRNTSKFVKRKMTLSAMGKASPATIKAASNVMGKAKARYRVGKADMAKFLKGRPAGGLFPITSSKVSFAAKALGKRTGIGKAVLAATAVAGAYEAGKRKLFSKKGYNMPMKKWGVKEKVQKKSTGGEIIIGRGVDLDLL